MNKRVKNVLVCIVGVFALAFALVLQTPIGVHAGFGDFNDYDYGGGYDSYDSYDSYDYDYDYDYDWGGSNYSSGRYSSGSSISPGMAVIIIVLVLIVVIASKKNTAAKKSTYTQPVKMQPVRQQPVKTLPDRTNQISDIIKQKDPAFTAPDFLTFAKQVYMDIQDAWEKRDLEPVRAVLHQNLYQQTKRQIEQKISDGIVNHLERISINTAYLTSYRSDAEYEYLSIYLAASMIDYQVREATGEIVYGNKETRWNMFYKMTFMRTIGAATRSAEEKDQGMMCPNCGAPLQGTSFGKCAYCDSTILTGVYDWVLSDFGVIKQDTVDEGIQIKQVPNENS